MAVFPPTWNWCPTGERIARDPSVFVIDPDHESRTAICALVKAMQMEVKGFASGEQFLARVDLGVSGCLIADFRIPQMTGLELLTALRQRGIHLPMILVTAYADVPLVVKALDQGVLTVIEKPFRENELWERIVQALRVDARRHTRLTVLAAFQEKLARLAPGERAVCDCMVQGVSNKRIANQLDVSLRTVELRRQSVLRKLGIESIAHLVWMFAQFSRELSCDQCLCDLTRDAT